LDYYIINDTCLVSCLSAFQAFQRLFDFSPVKLAACLKPTSRSNYRNNNGLLKGRNNAARIILQPTTCNLSYGKNDV